jgi:hypothetical protein
MGIAGGCASGDNNPNDSIDTITMTRLTPNIAYNDHKKNYHGFFGINQLYEGKSINPLYFGQAQKLNQPLSLNGQLTTPLFTNQCFLGTTVRGHTHAKNGILSASGTVVTYFEQHATKKGLSATLWQAQSLDFTPEMQADMNTILPKSLGTEINWNASYTVGTDLSFSLNGALFIPGAYYKKASGKLISLTQQAQLAQTDFAPDENNYPPALGNNVSFFINVQFTCLFDFSRLQNPFTTLKESHA